MILMAGKRGRLPGSVIRDNIVDLLNVLGESHGYDIYRHYKKLFATASLRSIYYHLKKGTELGVFEFTGVEKVEGDFSWGSGVERRKFKLGANARPKAEAKLKESVKKLNL